jgi:hypothetical protein
MPSLNLDKAVTTEWGASVWCGRIQLYRPHSTRNPIGSSFSACTLPAPRLRLLGTRVSDRHHRHQYGMFPNSEDYKHLPAPQSPY